jgi:two-component sensor histidine kinase
MKAHGADETEQFTLNGPDVVLPSKAVQALALAFHELTTNAVKYGALRSAGTSIQVAWEVQQGSQLVIHWREHGCEIKTKPERQGFGTQLLNESLPRLLGGTFMRSFHSDGMECTIKFPLQRSF